MFLLLWLNNLVLLLLADYLLLLAAGRPVGRPVGRPCGSPPSRSLSSGSARGTLIGKASRTDQPSHIRHRKSPATLERCHRNPLDIPCSHHWCHPNISKLPAVFKRQTQALHLRSRKSLETVACVRPGLVLDNSMQRFTLDISLLDFFPVKGLLSCALLCISAQINNKKPSVLTNNKLLSLACTSIIEQTSSKAGYHTRSHDPNTKIDVHRFTKM